MSADLVNFYVACRCGATMSGMIQRHYAKGLVAAFVRLHPSKDPTGKHGDATRAEARNARRRQERALAGEREASR